MNSIKKLILILPAILIFSVAVGAQTIAPPTVEYKTKPGKTSHGSFQIQNNNLQPVAFSVETYSVVFENKQPSFRVLDSHVHVELAQQSGRLSPKEIRRIDYTIKCDALPCQAVIKTGIVVGHTTDGLAVRSILCHIIYAADSKTPRRDILTAAGIPIPKQ